MRGALTLDVGKLPASLLGRLLARTEGSLTADVLLGPAVGEDACAIDLPGGVLVVATDPVTLTGREVGRYAVTVNANDVAVTGVRPRWFLATVLLPPGCSEAETSELFAQLGRGLDECGVALVGGHTEVTPAVRQAVAVGQMIGFAEDRRFVATGGVREGQVVIQVGAAPVEGAAVLASEFPAKLGGLDGEVLGAVQGALDNPGISVVDAALLAADLGATAMHDPTEGGLAAGLHEMAAASKVRLRVDRGKVLWWEPALEVCRAVGVDPWATLASGSLLAAFEASAADAAGDAFARAGHPAAVIAVAEAGEGVLDTTGEPVVWPERDELSRLTGSDTA
jgi:hydrogenase expression/formation protein HypE